jgi:hypothetical protein
MIGMGKALWNGFPWIWDLLFISRKEEDYRDRNDENYQ